MIFALAFFHWALLWGAGLAAIPVIIHLLHRRKFRTVAWAAMEFLLQSSKRTARRLKILQILLLLTRMLILMLLALALARPLLRGSFLAGFLTDTRSASVLILDNSYSMDYQGANETDFEAAKKIALSLAEQFRRGDSVTVLAASSPPEVIAQAVSDRKAIARAIRTMPLSHGGTDIVGALRKSLDILKAEKQGRKEIFILSDCRRQGWALDDTTGWARIRSMISELDVTPKVAVIDVSELRAAENRTLVSIENPARLPGVGIPYPITCLVRSSAAKPEGLPVAALYLDDEREPIARAEGTPFGENGISRVRFQLLFEKPGFHWGKVELAADPLRVDNSRYLSLKVRERLPVLCIDGLKAAAPFESGIDFVRLALAPTKAGPAPQETDEGGFVDPQVISVDRFWEADWGHAEMAVMSNVAGLTEEMHEALERFVRSGGGLVVFLGDNVNAGAFNALVENNASPLLPAALGEPHGEAAPAEQGGSDVFARISEADYTHPALAGFRDNESSDLSTAKFYRYYELKVAANDPSVRVLARLNDGNPFLVERHYGRGRVLLFATSCDAKWSNFPLKPSFVVLLHRLTYSLARGAESRYNIGVGEPMRLPLEMADRSASIPITTPKGYQVKVTPELGESGATAAETALPVVGFKDTDPSGIYAASLPQRGGTTEDPDSATPAEVAGSEVVYVAVNVDPAESDLTGIDERVAKGLFKSKSVAYLRRGGDVVEDLARSRLGREIWRYAFVFVLGLLMTESALARQIDKT